MITINRWSRAARVAVLLMTLVLLAAFATAAGNSPGRLAQHRLSTAALAAIVNRDLRNARPFNVPSPGTHGLKPGTVNAPVAGQTATASYNWGGYATYGTTPQAYSYVAGSWVVPKLSCDAEQRLSSEWVGLDGYSNSTVEQEGTGLLCFENQPYYYDWWEMYPAGSVEVSSAVRPGDHISASVTRTGDSYVLALTDSTTPAASFTTTQTCPLATCTDESAEWISERPAYSIGITPLAKSSKTPFSSASDTVGGVTETIAGSPNDSSITMVDATDTYPLQSVSGLNKGGNAFSMRWLDSY